MTATRAGNGRRTVTFVQPSLHRYREAFYTGLIEALDGDGVDVRVLHGPADPQLRARRDELTAPWADAVTTLSLSLAGRGRLTLHRLGRPARRSDLLVVEQAIRNVETYTRCAAQRLGGAPVAFWGHGSTRTKDHGRVQRLAKSALTRRAHWFFAYTAGGAAQVVADGLPAERVTVVRNTVDTAGLAGALAALTGPDVAAFRARHGLTPGRTGLFLGGLDDSKRVGFLLDAGRRIRSLLPGFRLLVAGDGPDRPLVEAATGEGWVVYLGPQFGREKALAGAAAEVMLMPGRVGLGIVDAFVLGTPVVTTAWPWHAPEIEYLLDGVNGLITPDDPQAYARTVAEHLLDPARVAVLVEGCRAGAADYAMPAMVANFRAGVLAALAEPRRRPGGSPS